MPVQYVKDFTFAPSPPRPTVQGYARGGHVKPSTPKTYARGGLAKGAGINKDTGAGHVEALHPAVAAKGVGALKYYAKGGLAKGSGVNKDTGAGHLEKLHPAVAAKGVGDLRRSRVSIDIKKSVGEKSSGIQKPAFAGGGKVAAGKIPNTARNPNDATSPGSFKRTPVSQTAKNSAAANSKFSAEGRNTPVATKQNGDVERMSGYSDFKNGGQPAFSRLKNLGHYAHGGKVRASGEKSAGSTGGGRVKAPVSSTNASKYESRAGTPKTSPGTRVEMKGGVAKASMGGLSRGTSPKKNAAIHAKSKKPSASKSAGLGALASALSGQGMPSQGAGAPPGMAQGMGAPPGGPMGGMAPQAPTMGGGPPAMANGGSLKSFTHVAYK